ncbi:MAG TPA: ABC transporter ATP-binding protein, partial [Desulfobacteraceae bacterium]|nr:ABC transporter ATP-binding protein [Desulfobacteraceae bacterium]
MTINMKGLTVAYTDGDHSLLALDSVDLTLSPGRVTALVGESGSGKTTLGKVLMGLLPENARVRGSVRLDETDILGLSETEKNMYRWQRVAMVFQDGQAGLNPVVRVLEQVAEPLVRRLGLGREAADVAARKRLEDVGLDSNLGARYPHELSGGQAQRVLLAMALVLDPKYLILDEPTAALDAMAKNFVSVLIRDLKMRGRSILLITHDLDLVSVVADDVALLYLGQIMEKMPASDLLTEPKHPYASALVRSFPGMEGVRELGGIRGDAFYRFIHVHSHRDGLVHEHSHVRAPGTVHEGGHAPPEGCLFEPRCTQAISECRFGEIKFTPAGSHSVRCLRGGIVEMLRMEGVSKTYGKVDALKPTDLKVKAGEVLCVVGETGSGKSTLAMIAAAAMEPDRGKRIFENRDMDLWIKQDYRSLARRIGIIYQNPGDAVSHRFSVFDIVAEPLRIQKTSTGAAKIRERVSSALKDVRLSNEPEFLKRYPHELNMGAIQRLCIARALVHDPVMLIADEPTSSLDPSVQAKVLKLLLGLQIEKGLTMLFVTHDVGIARKVADRISVMLSGRIVETGPASRIMN